MRSYADNVKKSLFEYNKLILFLNIFCFMKAKRNQTKGEAMRSIFSNIA